MAARFNDFIETGNEFILPDVRPREEFFAGGDDFLPQTRSREEIFSQSEFDPIAQEEERRGLFGLATDIGLSVYKGTVGIGQGLAWLAEKTDISGISDFGDWMGQQLSKTQDILTDSQSSQAREAIEGGALSSVEGFVHAVSESVPSFAVSAGIGGVAAKAIQGTARMAPSVFKSVGNIKKLADAGSVRHARIMANINKVSAGVGGAIGYGGSEGLIAAGSSGAAMEEIVMDMSHEQLFDSSDRYRQLYESAEDLSDEERTIYAKEILADEAGSEVANKVGLATALMGAPAGAVLGRLGRGIIDPIKTSSRLGATGIGAAAEAAQEFGQSGTEQLLTNLGIQKYIDPDQEATENVLNAAITGGLVGGVLGGGFGAAGYVKSANETPPSKDEERHVVDALNRIKSSNTDQTSAKQLLRWRLTGDVSIPEFVGAANQLANSGVLPEKVLLATEGDYGDNGFLTEKAFINDGWTEDGTVIARIDAQGDPDVLQALFDRGVSAYVLDNAKIVVPARDQKALEGALDGFKFDVVSSLMAQSGVDVVSRGTIIEPDANDDSASIAIDIASNQAATSPENDFPEPTTAQIQAGNYRKGHIRLSGLNISIENPRGSVRRGPGWSRKTKHHYGYITNTQRGADGDNIDVYLGPKSHRPDTPVFVVNQTNEDGSFDEHKVIMGYGKKGQAKQAYLSEFPAGWKGFGSIVEFDNAGFKDWLKNGDTLKPINPMTKRAMDRMPGVANPFQEATEAFQRKAQSVGLSQEQSEALAPTDQREPTFGYFPPETRVDTVRRAQQAAEQGAEAFYIEGDIVNLSGLNARLGTSNADVVLKKMGDRLLKAIESSGGSVIPIRRGGDELSYVVTGTSQESLDSAIENARLEGDNIAKEHGLTDLKHSKVGRKPGFGFQAASSRIRPGMTLSDIFSTADRRVELQKNVTREPTQEIGTEPPSQQPVRTGESVGEARDEAPQEAPQKTVEQQVGEYRDPDVKPSRRVEVQAHINSIQKNWTAKAQVVQSQSDLPKHITGYFKSMGVDGVISGAYDIVNGRAYLVADNIASNEQAEKVLFEEVLGHQGMRLTFGEELDSFLDQAYETLGPVKVATVANQYGADLSTTEGRRIATEEYLAKSDISDDPSLWESFISFVRRWMRGKGFNLQLSETEIKDIMDVVRSRVRDGVIPPRSDMPAAHRSIDDDGNLVRFSQTRDGRMRSETFVANNEMEDDTAIEVTYGNLSARYVQRATSDMGVAMVVEGADDGAFDYLRADAAERGMDWIVHQGGEHTIQILTSDGEKDVKASRVNDVMPLPSIPIRQQVEVEETGESVSVDIKSDELMSIANKRVQNLELLRNCI